MRKEQERRLIERARQGDQKALDQLMGEHEQHLRKFLGILGVQDQDVQDVTTRVREAAGKGLRKGPEAKGYDSSRADFHTWLTKCIAKEEAFRQLAKLHPRRIRAVLSKFGVHDQNIDDAAQDTWTLGWERLRKCPADGGYDSCRAGLYTWLTKCIAKYQALRWRTPARAKRSAEGQDPEHPSQIDDPAMLTEVAWTLRLKMLAYDEFLRITFLCGGSPHKQLAFGYSKLIHGQLSDRTVEGNPQEIDRRYGKERLPVLAERFPGCYEAEGGRISNRRVRDHMAPLRRRLPLKVKELVRPLPKHLTAVSDKVASDTCFREYYGREPQPGQVANHPISYWCDDVRRKVARMLGCEGYDSVQTLTEALAEQAEHRQIPPRGCDRCRLPRVPQCNGSADPEKTATETYV